MTKLKSCWYQDSYLFFSGQNTIWATTELADELAGSSISATDTVDFNNAEVPVVSEQALIDHVLSHKRELALEWASTIGCKSWLLEKSTHDRNLSAKLAIEKQYFCLDFKTSADLVERGLCLRVKARSAEEAATKIYEQQKRWQAEQLTIDDFYPNSGIFWPMFEDLGDGQYKSVGCIFDYLPEGSDD